MRLKAQLRFENNTIIPSNYWINLDGEYFDEGISIRGIPSTQVADQQQSYTFRLTAITPLLAEASLSMKFDILKISYSVSVIISFTQSSVITLPYTEFSQKFITFISSFFSVSQTEILLLSFSSTTYTTIQWTISTLSNIPCNFSELNRVREKLFDSSGDVQFSLRIGMELAVSWAPSTVEIKLSGSCNPPRVNATLPILNVPQYDVLDYYIPSNVFTGGGSSLELMLLDSFGNNLPTNSWVWFSNDTRRIVGFPLGESGPRYYNYMLRAKNSDGLFADQNITIYLSWTSPSYNLAYQITFAYHSLLLPKANIIATFLQRLKSYFGRSSSQDIIVIRADLLVNFRVVLFYQNTTLPTHVCDVKANNIITDKLRSNRYASTPNSQFVSAMQPDITVTSVQIFTYGNCLVSNRKRPQFQSLDQTALNFATTIKTVSQCAVESYLVPDVLFLDEEEGNTRNLRLSLTNDSLKTLPIDNWVNINSTSQTIYAVVDDKVIANLPIPYVQYRLYAFDSDGKSDYVSLKFNISGFPSAEQYNVSMQIELNEIANDPYPVQLAHIYEELKKVFDNDVSFRTRSYKVSFSFSKFVATFVWSPCHISGNVCNIVTINFIRSRLFGPGRIGMNENLSNYFQGSFFKVTSVSESVGDICQEDPPRVQSKIPDLHVGFCGILQYKIPSNTFSDKQDGNTHKLKLQLLQSNGMTIPIGNWLQFDAQSQTITAILTKEQSSSSFPKEHIFMLVATDSTNLSVNTSIKVTLNATMPSFSHTFTVRATLSPSLNELPIYRFSKKLQSYFGEEVNTNQIISSTEVSDNGIIVTWANCSLRYDPCDVIGISKLRSRLQTTSGVLQSAFAAAMQPDFTQLLLSEANSGPCLRDEPPKLSLPFGPISVSVCQTYKALIPENTFTDKEQGGTRNLELSLKDNIYYWISLDAKKQELEILLTDEIAKAIPSKLVEVTIVAKDLNLQQVKQELKVNIVQQTQAPSHKILMQYRIRAKSAQMNFVELYDVMRKNITEYFRTAPDHLSSVEFHKLPMSPSTSSVLSADWSSCSFARSSCDQKNINQLSTMIKNNPAFKAALEPYFEVTAVDLQLSGICKEQAAPPTVQNTLPSINVSSCGFTEYQIPSDTFYDPIDGSTRNLSLRLLNSTGQVPTEAWIQLDKNTQTLRIVIAGNEIESLPAPRVVLFKIKATTKRGLSVTESVRIHFPQPLASHSIQVKINFAWIKANPPSRSSILRTLTQRFSSYLGGVQNDIQIVYIKQEPTVSYPYFVIRLANCSISYSPCDKAYIATINPKLQNVYGTVPAFKSAMGSEMYLTYIQILEYGPCLMENSPPFVHNPLGKIQVNVCSNFTYTISSSTFRDEEDSNLAMDVTKIDGIPVSGNYRWLYMLPSEAKLFGIITSSVIKNQPLSGYNVTIRATDGGGLFAEAHLIIQILGNKPQELYQFSLQLSRRSLRQQFLEELEIIATLNSFFSSRFTNIISYRTSKPSTINVQCSICVLENKCDEASANYYFTKITVAQNIASDALQRYFSTRYTIVSAHVYRDRICLQPQNPPVPLSPVWTITGSYCNGILAAVPKNMFKDLEDGNTRNLELSLYTSNKQLVPSTFWVQINKTSQVIYGRPTRAETLAYSSSTEIILVAKDKTGLEGNISIQFLFTSYPEPRYIYKLSYHSRQVYSRSVDEMQAFSKKLQLYLKDSSASVGLIKYSVQTTDIHYFQYANCSVSYNPCDTASLYEVKDLLLTSSNLGTSNFRNAMGDFLINYGEVQALSPCNTGNLHPPTVVNRITNLNISVCSMYSHLIPDSTFYDTEDGNTRKLTLALANAKNQPISKDFWLQLNSTSQTIYGYITAAMALELSSYSFILIATDKTSLSASNSFTVKAVGPYKILHDCQIQIVLRSSTITSHSNVELVKAFSQSLQRYFSLGSSEVGLVDFQRHSSNQFTFSWSYCASSYSSYSSTVKELSYSEYKTFITKVLMLLFESDHKTVKRQFYAAFNGFSVVSVKTIFSGVCKNLPPILVSITEVNMNIHSYGYSNKKIQAQWFYDFEDGNTYNLDLKLVDFSKQVVGSESWINVDMANWYLLASLQEKQRALAASRFSFYLRGTDSGGKSAYLPVYVTKLASTITKSPFTITFEYIRSSTAAKDIFVNQTVTLSDITSSLYSLNSGKNIITIQYTVQFATKETCSFTWIPYAYESCSTSTTLQKTKLLLSSNRELFESFKLAYSPQFKLQRAYYVSSCGVPDLPPGTPDGSFVINMTMCSPLRYKLPPSTFVDSIDGEMPNMKVRLLDSNKAPVSSSSWLQLNTATLELYGIFQSSMLAATVSSSLTSVPSSSVSSDLTAKAINFYLEATNSRGLKVLNPFKVNVLNYPFTSDCYSNITVKRTFGTINTLDLDVLYRLVQAISQYYGDKTIQLKVYRFAKISTDTYSLVFSNCSFVHSSLKAAMWGLNESHRSSITAIFSRIVESNGTVRSSFYRHLAINGFVLKGVSNSYSCIEEGPTSNIETLRLYAFACKVFEDPLASDLFTDKRDGTNLELSLCYTNGVPVSPNEWVQLDATRRVIYGVVTFAVKINIPMFYGYKYLIVARDSSGRTANVSYSIKIANAVPLQFVRFHLGFQSVFTGYSKTADILLNLTRKLAAYLNNNNYGQDVVFFSYDAIRFVSFELCPFQCKSTAMTSILTKLQRQLFKPVPSDAFIVAMGPEITPLYIHVDGPQCIESTTITIVASSVITRDQETCGSIDYIIPNNLFSNSLGETTRDFLLTLKTANSGTIGKSSLIRFNQGLQTIQGVAVLSKLSRTLTYVLSASSSKSVAKATSTNVKINFPRFEAFKQTEKRLCVFTITVITSMNPDLSDVSILRKFMLKIGSYFSVSMQQIHISHYTRSNTYPIKLTIHFSKCSWLYLLQTSTSITTYYQNIEAVLKSVFRYEGTTIKGVSSSFIKAMQPEFTVLTVTRNSTTCSRPPDLPPRYKNLDPITIAPCGEFSYQIPNDLFSDEDGNTRNLKVEVLQSDGKELPFDSWIIFDNNTQTISGLPLNATLTQQPQNGYVYRVKATDRLNQAAFAQLIIKLNGNPYQKYDDAGISLHYSSSINSKYQMVQILAFTRKVSSYIGDSLNRFRVIDSSVTPTGISMKLMNCTRCDTVALLKFYSVQTTRGKFNLHMAPEFPISFHLKAEGKCNPGGNSQIVNGSIYNITLCERSTLNFLNLSGLTQMPPDVKIIVRNETQQVLPRNSWFWFNESSSTLEAFPSESLLKSQPSSGTAFSTSTALISTGERITSFKKDALLIFGTPPTTGLQYTAKFTASLPADSVDAYLISLVFTPLYAYLKRKDLQVASFKREQGNQVKFELKFLLCGLPSDCTNPSVKSIYNKIFELPNKFKSEFTKIFSEQISIISMADNCKDSPPVIPYPNLNITIPVCGIYRYKIPNTFAHDAEDGGADNLSISLRMSDNSLLGRDSWIQFNETSHEIHALPYESFVRSERSNGWPYLIVVQDKGGKQATAKLTVYLSPDETAFFKLGMSIQTVNVDRRTPFLDIQIRFLTMLSSFYSGSSLSHYRVLSFTKTKDVGADAEKFYIKFGNCSIAQTICQKSDKELKSSLSDLHTSISYKNSQFYKYMSSSFLITSVQNESRYTIDNPPKVLNLISTIRLDTCGMHVAGIPSGTFYDEQQGVRLNTTLTFENGTRPGSNFWIQYISNKLYVVPYGTIKSGTYRMVLTASDRCLQMASTSIIIQFIQRYHVPSYLLEMQAMVRSAMPAVYYISQLKSSLEDVFHDSIYQVSITHFVRKDWQLVLQWEYCTVICNHTQINVIRQKTLLETNVVRLAISSSLSFNVTNSTEIYTNNCSKPTSDPPVPNKSISLKVPLCSHLNFAVPVDTFYDTDDGNTRNLHLVLLTESKQPLGIQSWIQLDYSKQIVYGYPRLNDNRPIQRIFKYSLLATDKSGYSAATPLTVEITGEAPVISYTLSLSGTTTFSQNTPLVVQEISLISRIGRHFHDFAINNMGYSRTMEAFKFKWSFCSMKSDPCDCYKIKNIRSKLTPLQAVQRELGSEFTMASHITDQMVGTCSRTQKPELRYDRNEMRIVTGQYFSYAIRDDKFYDYEDGYTRNLTLFMSDGKVYFDNFYWIKIQDYQICGLMTVSEAMAFQTNTVTSKEYKTVARDNCGKETSDSYLVRITSKVRHLQYRITVIINGEFGTNCSQINSFIYKISSYINTPVAYIFVSNYTSSSTQENSTSVSWGIWNITENNCNNKTVKELRKQFLYENGTRTSTFYNHMKPQFEV